MAMFNDSYNSGSSAFSGTQIGGGFIQNENYDSTNKPSRAQVPYDQRKLSQVTIKQIQHAKPDEMDGNLVIDGQEISQIQMIAQIQSINIQSSHTTLKVNDYTGSLDAKQWSNDNQPQENEMSNLREGTWVKIYGRLSIYQGRANINIFQIFTITNFDEITHHFLECIYSHLLNTKQPQQQQQQKMMNNNNNNNNNNNKGWNNNNNNNGSNWNNNNNMNNNNNNNNNSNSHNPNLPMIQNRILAIINSPEFESSETGCNVEVLFQRLPNDNVNEIRSAMDELANAGHLYSTVDEDHYKYSGDQQ